VSRSKLVVAALALAIAAPAMAEETIQANALRVGTGAPNTRLTVRLDRYSTDEERAQWRAAFAANGQEGLVAAWQESNVKVGTLSLTGTMGYQLRAAVSVPTESGRRIFLVTDRPISGYEMLGGSRRTEDYPIGVIEVDVDAEGKGEGQMIGAAELVVENDRLVIKTLRTDPTRLTQVTVKSK
jgi:hypothetical protein